VSVNDKRGRDVTTPGPCPSEQHIAAFADGLLSPAEREAIGQHIDRCEACFDLVATLGVQATGPLPAVDQGLRAAVMRAGTRSRGRRLLPALSAAAAILVAVVWWRAPAQVSPAPQPGAKAPAVETARSTATGSGVVVDEPRDGDNVEGQSLVRWQGPREAASYEVLLTTVSGDVILKRQVQGSDRQLRLDVPGHQGEVGYLWVDAYLPEGRRVSSNVVKVTIRR
jgi:anti-sigma factor RsiW